MQLSRYGSRAHRSQLAAVGDLEVFMVAHPSAPTDSAPRRFLTPRAVAALVTLLVVLLLSLAA